MPKSSMQKQKLLYLQKIMLEKTDENHGLTASEIIQQLNMYGIKCERKSLYDDLNILSVFGLDICRTRTTTVKYYVGSREFEIPELKLLVDAIQSSKFITPKKSLSLIDKLSHLVSENEAHQLQRQVYVSNRVKNINEKIYYNVDTLHNAISADRQVTFKYCRWETDFSGKNRKIKLTERKNGELYVVSPWALWWDDENYYLIAYDGDADMIKHYRVDKMDSILITEKCRDGKSCFESFDLSGYTTSVFSMFGGKLTEVKLSVDNEFVGVIADRFGSDVFIAKESDKSFTVSVSVVLSPQFYAWVFGLDGGVRILSPENAVEEYRDKLSKSSSQYIQN